MADELPPSDPSSGFPGFHPDGSSVGGTPVKMSSAGAPGGWSPLPVEEVARLLPQYEILTLLGRGGMGAVYAGRQPALDRRVAIKFLPLEISIHQDFVDRFVREARAMARLEHPNIVAVHDFGQTAEGHLYFVMDYVEGATLRQMLQAQAAGAEDSAPTGLAADQVLGLISQVCAALAYAHDEGVIHRDIKPPNVLVDRRGRVKVADFGLARLVGPAARDSDLTFTGLVMGTADYMAPEQRRGMDVDHRADIYSTGVMLYELLTGEVPRGAFRAASAQVPGVDARLDEVIHRALQGVPEDRYASSQEMRADLEAIRASPAPFAVEDPEEPPTVSAFEKTDPGGVASQQQLSDAATSNRKPALLYGGIAAGVLALCGGTFAFWPKKAPLPNALAAPGAQGASEGAAQPSPKPASAPSTTKNTAQNRGADSTPNTSPSITPAPQAVPQGSHPWLISKTVSVPPPPDALEFQGSKYKLIHEECTWIEAKTKAESMGGHLATITRDEEQTWVANSFGRLADPTKFWIGAFIPPDETTPRWITGEVSTYSKWRYGEPQIAAKRAPGLPATISQSWTSQYSANLGWVLGAWNEEKRWVLVEWDRFSAADAAANDPANWKDWLPIRGADEVNQTGHIAGTGIQFANGAVRVRFEALDGPRVNLALRATKIRTKNDYATQSYTAELNANGLSIRKELFYASTKKTESELLNSAKNLVVLPKSGSHLLEFRGIGDVLLVYFNGELVLSTRDQTYSGGSVACTTKGSTLSPTYCRITEFSTLVLNPDPTTTLATPDPDSTKPVITATPKPLSEMEKWLVQVDGPMQENYQREVIAPRDAEVTKLKTGYGTVLDQQIATTSNAGQLEAAVAWRAERQRYLDAGQALPPDDSDLAANAAAKGLVPLRTQFRTHLIKLETDRLTRAKTVFARYEAALAPNITKLTQARRLDDALLLKAKLEEVKKAWLTPSAHPPAGEGGEKVGGAGAQPSGVGGTPTSTPAPATNTRPVLKKYPKGDDRQAAEWVLTVGGSVTVQTGTTTKSITRSNDLPKGRFLLTEVRLVFDQSKPKQPVEDLEPLAGLDDLAYVEISNLPLRDEQLAPLTSLARLTVFRINAAALTDNCVDYVLAMPSITDFRPFHCESFKGSRLGELTRTKINSLGFYGTPLQSLAYEGLRRLTALKYLAINHTDSTDADLAQLADLRNLQTLYLSTTRISLAGLSAIKSLQNLQTFGWSLTPGHAPEELAQIHQLFPNLSVFEMTVPLGDTTVWREADIAAFGIFHNLTQLRMSSSAFGDDAARGLLALKKLPSVDMKNGSSLTDVGLAALAEHKAIGTINIEAPGITDAGLLKLVPIKSLKRLIARKCPQLTEAGFASFAKARPDVALER